MYAAQGAQCPYTAAWKPRQLILMQLWSRCRAEGSLLLSAAILSNKAHTLLFMDEDGRDLA